MINVCLLGASGSIGQQSIDVMRKNPSDFNLVSFSVGNRTRCIRNIILRFPSVKAVYLRDKSKKKTYAKKYPNVSFYSKEDIELENFALTVDCDMVINALVGTVGLKPSIRALENDKVLALANKESLIIGGELINNLLKEGHGKLYPIDSEHVGLAKCIAVDDSDIQKYYITASGGAFRNLSRDQLKNVEAKDALAHPTWHMGSKITIDSATMVNKTFEIIEAHYLFGIPFEKIGVKMNYESKVHAFTECSNGYRLDISKPDMRIPIKWAIYQGQIPYQTFFAKDLDSIEGVKFAEFNKDRYPVVKHAETVIKKKGTYGAVLNIANEVSVYAFLEGKIPFLAIEEIIDICMKEHKNIIHPTLDQLLDVLQETYAKATILCEQRRVY